MQSDVDTTELDLCVEDTFPLLQRRSRGRARSFLRIRAEPADLFSLEHQLVADEVNTPTGSDSGSLTEDTNGAGPEAIVTNVDLSEEVVDISAALERYNIEKDITTQIRMEFNKRPGPTGTSSSTGAFAPALLMTKQFIYSYTGSLAIVMSRPSALSSTHRAAGGSEWWRMSN
ncbi:hypothetical protein C8Q76DRAFT_802523 [Earliella scabrosa]|nr:hypothetical protein C8Q76DRAFT_802523 [Earliella scabrosa]